MNQSIPKSAQIKENPKQHLEFKYLKQNVSIESILIEKGLYKGFTKYTDHLVGPCPIHKGDNPKAFVISLAKNVWHCFTRCNTGGDLIDFVRRLQNISYRQTAEYLASFNRLSHSSQTNLPTKSFRPFTRKLELKESFSWIQKKGIKKETARYFEAGFYQGNGFLKECVGVRLHDLNGNPIGYAGRRLKYAEEKQYGKWKFPSNLPKKEILYNYHRVASLLKKGVMVVEDPWSVMRLAQLNIPAVALLGIQLSPLRCHLFQNIPQVILMLDGDLAGRQATLKLHDILTSYTQVHQVDLPPDFDPDDLNDTDLLSIVNCFSY